MVLFFPLSESGPSSKKVRGSLRRCSLGSLFVHVVSDAIPLGAIAEPWRNCVAYTYIKGAHRICLRDPFTARAHYPFHPWVLEAF